MRFITKVTQRLRQIGTASRLRYEAGLINTTDLLVATGATVVLAAGVSSAVIGTLDEAKYGKAQPDGQAIAAAISQFYSDTGKWPGQAEAAPTSGTSVDATFLVTTTDSAFLPDEFDNALDTDAATCQNNSLQGFVGVTINASTDFAEATLLNINDYLVNKPAETSYPNWQGPYLQTEMKTDPWDRAWFANLQPLYCSELISTGAGGSGSNTITAGNLGYAWLYTGGSNRTISSDLHSANLDETGDDAGANLGKLTTRSTGGADANGDQ